MNKFLSFSRSHLLAKENKLYFIKDTLYGCINFSESQIWLYELVNTFEFQRLHKLRQMSLSYMNFPGAMHTRFMHSLGSYELCNRFIKEFLEQYYLDREKDRIVINIALASALLHDIGHGPLSHVFEYALPEFKHEEMGIRIIRSRDTKINRILREKALKDGLNEEFYVDEVCGVLEKSSKYEWVVSLISSDLDVDRLDYLARDSFYSGVNYGKNIDLDLFIKWAAIKDGRLVFLNKIEQSLRYFALTRKHMYENLYENYVGFWHENLLVKAFHFVRDHIDSCKEIIHYKDCAFLFRDKPENWEIERFVEVHDDMLMEFLEESLKANYRYGEARDILGYLFGVWVDEEGRFCGMRGSVDVRLIDDHIKQNKKFDLRVPVWDSMNGVKEFVV